MELEDSRGASGEYLSRFRISSLSRRKLMVLFVASCVFLILYNEMTSLANMRDFSLEKGEYEPDHNIHEMEKHNSEYLFGDYEYPKLKSHCQHTQQGARLACDSNGIVCNLMDLNQLTSCCGHDSPHYAIVSRYTCTNCDLSSHCCSNYETCVSCCLHPHHLQKSRHLHLREARSALRGVDDFTWCTFTCHTSSLSVMHSENTFRSDLKHCFMGIPPVQNRHSVNSDRGNS